jgi:hypothetical protein
MDVILAHVTTQDRHPSGFAGLAKQLPSPQSNIALQNLIAALRHPHEVALDVKDGVRTLAVLVAHRIPPMSHHTTGKNVLKLFA